MKTLYDPPVSKGHLVKSKPDIQCTQSMDTVFPTMALFYFILFSNVVFEEIALKFTVFFV